MSITARRRPPSPRSPQNDFAFDAMSGGWGRIMQGIGRVAAELG